MYVALCTDHRYRSDALPTHSGHHDTRFGERQSTQFFLHALDTLWRTGLCQLRHPKGVGMVLHGLVPASMHTPSLFDEVVRPSYSVSLMEAASERNAMPERSTAPVQNAKTVRDPTRLLAAMDIIYKTQGKNALYFATAYNALNNASTRIGFNRIPDIETER
jgi:DNA polymerase IV